MAIAKRKKKFFNVDIPLIRKETQLRAYDLSDLVGKFLKYDLTRSLRGKGTLMQFKVEVKDDKAVASPRQIRLLPFFLKRMVRKGTNYVEDSFSTETKDAIIRIKPFLVTRRKVSRNVRKALRNLTKEELTNYAKENTTIKIFEDILNNKLQKELSLKLKKVYPLSLCEIRVLKVEKDKETTTSKKE